MSYPKECPVFVTPAGFLVQLTGAAGRDHLSGEWGAEVVFGDGSTSCRDSARVSQLVPLTPAAEELLAAIRQELGL